MSENDPSEKCKTERSQNDELSARSMNHVEVDPESVDDYDQSSSKHHKKTIKLSKDYEHDLLKVKSILEEDIMDKIDISVIDSFYGYENKEKKSEEKRIKNSLK